MNPFQLLRSLFTGLREGPVQTVKVRSFDTNGREDVERWQDYGFAGNPGDGQGLVLEFGGHTIVFRMDRIDSRPQLQVGEVAVWHKEGHKVLLSEGRKITIECDDYGVVTKRYSVKATESATFDTPSAAFSKDVAIAGRADIEEGASVDGVEFIDHGHKQVQRGNDVSGGVNK